MSLGSTINEHDFIYDSSNTRRYRATCNKCGKDRGYVRKNTRHKMCMSCGQKGKKGPRLGHTASEETKEKLRDEQTKRLASKGQRKRTVKEKRIIHTIRTRLWQTLNGISKSTSSIELLGCPTDELKHYIETKWLPGMSWDNWGLGPNKWQIDHITRLASFDLQNKDELKKAGHFSNLQPLWYEDHLKKTISENTK